MIEVQPNLARELQAGIMDDDITELPRAAGFVLTFPYLEMVASTPPWEPLPVQNPHEVFNFYEEMTELFINNPLPQAWTAYLEEIAPKRNQNGCSSMIDLVSIANFVIEENPELAQQLNLRPTDLETFKTKDDVISLIDGILANPALKEYMTQQLISSLPDVGGYVSDYKASEVSKRVNTENGIFVDLGCGIGETTEETANEMNMQIVGIDRQMHALHYSVWKQKDRKAAFMLADLRQETVIPADSARVVRIRNVAQHVTEEALTQIITEGARILEPETGIMLIGPVSCDEWDGEKPSDGEWRFFRKTQTDNGNYELRRVRYRELVPDARY